ncbi:Cellulose synthase [Quillaja saponaria]|uniref:Cellulose synthase n=1 Tax=Quillaja saponaria TaxID=32244 RepID=A0AAD7PE38_QUISA|nr:Cellulose synthase [Quillaja saponaria]
MLALLAFKLTLNMDGLPLHTLKFKPGTLLNRLFALVYTCGIIALLYHHVSKLNMLHSDAQQDSIIISLTFLLSDFLLAFLWTTRQAFHMRPVHRHEYPENLLFSNKSDFPALDVFICTADPYKEPPMDVVNTALSVMAYEYPPDKVSVYVSDDGGSQLTLFAFMEAAKFATHWLPFCTENNLLHRSPEAFFASTHSFNLQTHKIKTMFEGMRTKVEQVVARGKVDDNFDLVNEQERKVFNKYWTDNFAPRNHPTVIQVLLQSDKDKDIKGQEMPNLIYLSREKTTTLPHNFKAGALNALLRVSATMTNAPVVLTLDCDTYSNDPKTPSRALCYLLDPKLRNKLAYVQFPQRFHGLNKNDIYALEYKGLFHINMEGVDGLAGPNYVGACCFFNRRAFFGGPSFFVSPELPELSPEHVFNKPILNSQQILARAYHVANSNYENQTKWGSEVGFRYGSLVEDFYTGYRMQCDGWKAMFCNPDKAAFLGDSPINLLGMLNQCKRWSIGLLQVAFSRYNPLTFGFRSMGPLMGLAYAHYAFWSIWSIPLTVYAFIPQLALLSGVSIFPKVSDPWFILHVFLFLGAYGKDCLDFVLAGSTFARWWNDQRIWMIKGVSCFLFGFTEYCLKAVGISTHGFSLTSKVFDNEQSKRYEQGIFEFGVPSPMFVTLTTAAIINLAAFVHGLLHVFRGSSSSYLDLEYLKGMFVQMFIAGFVVINSRPIYEAMVIRSDKGRMPTEITLISACLACVLYASTSPRMCKT